ncbi:hypothetical protein V7152_05715 [Neobacillus drentensis]|uniref:hypothetical protein n=1 Tax=Neobacillus drentensis TaxID=220684 RepID=UPI002FFE2F8A
MKRGLPIIILILAITIIVFALAIYQDIRYKTGELIIVQKYEQNSINTDYDLAHYGVVDAKFKGKDITIIVDSYGSSGILVYRILYFKLMNSVIPL